jgi:hypothetical protein
MSARATLIKLKPGSLDRVREWARTLSDRRDEALATLADEGVSIESWFLFSRDDGDYLVGYMRSDDFAKADRAVRKSLHAIDAYHQEFKRDTWEPGANEDMELLVDLESEGDR